MWELSIALCQRKSKVAVCIKEAKAACSQATLDAHATCSQAITCSKAISEVEAYRVLQAELFQREDSSIMWDLEGQVIQEESRC